MVERALALRRTQMQIQAAEAAPPAPETAAAEVLAVAATPN